MKINTDVLKKALDFLSMGISKSSDKYETQLIEFETSNGRLKAYTSDDINKLGIRICDTTEELNVTLKFDILYNLVKACKDDEVEIVAAKNYTQFKTNTISCRLSTFTHVIARPKFPAYDKTMEGRKISQYLPIIKSILNTSHVEECYRYVYFSDNVMVTDTDNVAIIDEKLFNNILISLHSLEILSSFDNFELVYSSNCLCAKCGDKIVEISLMDSSKYQYSDILALFSQSSPNKIEITKSTLSSAINTASLFDSDSVELIFSDKGLTMEMPKLGFKYILSTESCSDMKYNLPLTLLKKFLVIGDNLTIGYNDANLIGIENDKIKALFGVESNGD